MQFGQDSLIVPLAGTDEQLQRPTFESGLEGNGFGGLALQAGEFTLEDADGVLSLFVCVACMFTLFAGQQLAGKALFGLSLLLLMASLGLSVAEIHISTEALKIQLSAMEEDPDAKL